MLLYDTKGQSFEFSVAKDLSEIPTGSPPTGAPKRGKKVKGFPYSTLSVGPGADPSVQAVSLQVTVSHTPGGRLPLLSARPTVTFLAAEHHRPLAGTNVILLGDRGT